MWKKFRLFSIFSSVERCDACQKKYQIEHNEVKTKSSAYIPPVKQRVIISKPFSGSVGGHIEYYKLQEWWLNTLTADERDTLLSLYKPLGLSPDSLILCKITLSSQSAVAFLSNLSSWVKKPEYRKNRVQTY